MSSIRPRHTAALSVRYEPPRRQLQPTTYLPLGKGQSTKGQKRRYLTVCGPDFGANPPSHPIRQPRDCTWALPSHSASGRRRAPWSWRAVWWMGVGDGGSRGACARRDWAACLLRPASCKGHRRPNQLPSLPTFLQDKRTATNADSATRLKFYI